MARPTSYGVLLFRRGEEGIRFLLGKIPQGNFWTVFKGMPEVNETPYETALREFQEETGSSALKELSPIATLTGKTSQKTLEIFLQEWTQPPENIVFDIDQVVKIDSGYMAGRPEIIDIKWLSLDQAMNGVHGAKIYKSQETILSQAYEVIVHLQDQEENV
jgi:8-oxo-dGTP pyrophosphatase MutT (NUDIX family)